MSTGLPSPFPPQPATRKARTSAHRMAASCAGLAKRSRRCQFTGEAIPFSIMSKSATVRAHDSPRTSGTVDHFGRILIPKAIREAAGLREGTEVDIVAEGDHL